MTNNFIFGRYYKYTILFPNLTRWTAQGKFALRVASWVTCERREIQCRIHGKCKQWSSWWSWNFPAAGKQTKLNLIGRIRHVTHLRANSVYLGVKKQNISIYSWKMGPYLLGKRTSCWWRHETMGNIHYVEFNFLNIKFYVFKMFLPHFNRIEWKIEKRQLFQKRLFLALFILAWGKDDVIVTSLLIWFGFSLS